MTTVTLYKNNNNFLTILQIIYFLNFYSILRKNNSIDDRDSIDFDTRVAKYPIP